MSANWNGLNETAEQLGKHAYHLAPTNRMVSVIYPFTNSDFPSRKASYIQVTNTCHALAKTKRAVVHLVLRKWGGMTIEDCLKFYGLPPEDNLFVHVIAIPASSRPFVQRLLDRSYFCLLCAKVAQLAFRERRNNRRPIVYTRDVKVASAFARLRPLLRMPVFHELHEIHSWELKHQHECYSDRKPVPQWKVDWYHRKEKRAWDAVDGLVSTTHTLKDIIVSRFGVRADKVTVAPNGVSVNCRLADLASRESPPKRIGYIGQLYPWKGVDTLIKAMEFVDGNAELFIVGGTSDGEDLRRLKDSASELGLSSRVEFVGYVEPARIHEYLQRADVWALPTIDNPFASNFTCPLKQFEYMTTKRPIAASDLPSIRETLRHGENALLVEPDKPRALAEAINNLLADGRLAKRIAETAYRQVVEKYTWSRRAEKVLDTIEKVLDGCGI